MTHQRFFVSLLLLFMSIGVATVAEAAPEKKAKPLDLSGSKWIWSTRKDSQKSAHLTKSFDLKGKVKAAHIVATCDNSMEVSLNEKKILFSGSWESPVHADVTKHLKTENFLSAMCKNEGAQAGFILKLQVVYEDGKSETIVTNDSWKAQPAVFAGSSKSSGVVVYGNYGMGPWGTLPKGGAVAALPPSGPTVAEGFEIELLYTVPKGEKGSWVAMTVLPDGRLVASDQGGKGLFYITPPKVGSDEKAKVEKLPVAISNAQGMVWAFDALYVNRNGGGLWRVTDSTGDGNLDKAEELVKLEGGGEHGPHAVIKTEDGKGLYVVGGNHTTIPSDLTGSRVPRVWSEDLLLPRQWDAKGHARGRLAPGGWVARVSPDGKERVLYSTGYRNEYDIALNKDGEMFTFDSDMEWDFGMPWYRPTRVNHVVSGSEYGWRSGTGKWPTYYEDSLPPVVNIGPASPTGVVTGVGATKFPIKWQDAVYILDWTYGTIWAVHLEPNGASYTAKVDEFVSGKPLPVTDAIIGTDGHFYFTVGGRGTQSALYRVRYTGTPEPTTQRKADPFAKDRALRRSLEAFHGKVDAKAVQTAWPHLSSNDRFIRFAARIAIEHQPVTQWQGRVFDEDDTQSLIQGVIALARHGDKSLQFKLLDKLYRLDFAGLSADHKLGVLRAMSLTFTRMGRPDRRFTDTIAKKIDASYPDKDDRVNAELVQMLVYLNSPTVVDKTMKLMAEAKPTPKPDWHTVLGRNGGYGGKAAKMVANMPPLQNMRYVFALRNHRFGWSLDQRRQYFQFLIDASKFSGGESFSGFINNIRKEALANCSNAERVALKDLTGENVVGSTLPKLEDLPTAKGPARIWKASTLVKLAANGLRERDFENGKKMFYASRCVLCHRFDGEGGAVGPDLTGVVSRFSHKDLADSMIDPSRVVSDQYASTRIDTKDGDVIVGRVVSSDGDELKIMLDPYNPDKLRSIKKSDIAEQKVSKVSIMPENLIDTMNAEEALDLMAYLLSRGDKSDRMFKK